MNSIVSKIAIIALLCAVSAQALPVPKCRNGVGLTDPSNPVQTGTALPGECTPCADPNCATCDDNYKVCNTCYPTFGPTNLINCTDYDGCPPTIAQCVACPPGCAGCSLDATQCLFQTETCPVTPIVAALDATKDNWTVDGYCQGQPGMSGNGYVATFTAVVKNGTCINCSDKTEYGVDGQKEGFGTRIPPFCTMLSIGQNVAANAFGPNCTSPSLTLVGACHSSRSFPGEWEMTLVFNGTCNGQSLQIAAEGGWKATDPTSSPSMRANVISEVIQVDPPEGAPSNDYGDYSPPSPGLDDSYNSEAPAESTYESPSPSPEPEVSPSPEPDTAADVFVNTPLPTSQWKWASSPIVTVTAVPTTAPAVAPAAPAVAPAPSAAVKVSSGLVGAVLACFMMMMM